jgi:hypothetical protein
MFCRMFSVVAACFFVHGEHSITIGEGFQALFDSAFQVAAFGQRFSTFLLCGALCQGRVDFDPLSEEIVKKIVNTSPCPQNAH